MNGIKIIKEFLIFITLEYTVKVCDSTMKIIPEINTKILNLKKLLSFSDLRIKQEATIAKMNR